MRLIKLLLPGYSTMHYDAVEFHYLEFYLFILNLYIWFRSKSVCKVPHLLIISTKKMKEMEKIDGSTSVKEQKWNLETYTEDDANQLGDYKIPWILFHDGYENGRRLYDKCNGRTCHQCRYLTFTPKCII